MLSLGSSPGAPGCRLVADARAACSCAGAALGPVGWNTITCRLCVSNMRWLNPSRHALSEPADLGRRELLRSLDELSTYTCATIQCATMALDCAMTWEVSCFHCMVKRGNGHCYQARKSNRRWNSGTGRASLQRGHDASLNSNIKRAPQNPEGS